MSDLDLAFGSSERAPAEAADARYQAIARSDGFRTLVRRKMAFVWPVTILFVAFYLLLPLLAGYARPLMGSFVVGHVTFGYAYGLIYYVVAWALAYVYVRAARSFDARARELAGSDRGRKGR